MVDNDEIEAARAECDATYVGPGPCYFLDYMEARYHYQALLVKAGRLDPKLAEKRPKPFLVKICTARSDGAGEEGE